MPDMGSQAGELSGAGEVHKSAVEPEAKVEPEATVEVEAKAEVKTVAPENETPELKVSDKPGFDPNTTQDGRVDKDDNEGGISKSTTTGVTGLATDVGKGGIIQPMVGDRPDKFELVGFTVQYKVPGTKEDVLSQEIREFFDTLEEAQGSIEGTTYKHKMLDGTTMDTTITRGMPQISKEDVLRFEYKEEVWTRP